MRNKFLLLYMNIKQCQNQCHTYINTILYLSEISCSRIIVYFHRNLEMCIRDRYRSCRNKCMFCFIDQMPKGMRETLYFKDDDSRLSFLQGNYITLTNMSDHDVERIVKYRLEPINISFQTTNPELRCKMLHNRFAGEALKKVDRCV